MCAIPVILYVGTAASGLEGKIGVECKGGRSHLMCAIPVILYVGTAASGLEGRIGKDCEGGRSHLMCAIPVISDFCSLKLILCMQKTAELISLNSAIVQSEVWSQLNAQQIAESKRKKNDFKFSLIFGLSLNLGLSERLVQ